MATDLINKTQSRLQQTNEALSNTLKQKCTASNFWSATVLTMLIYFIFVATLAQCDLIDLKNQLTMIISTNILLITFTLVFSFMIRSSYLDLTYYGITLKNGKRELKTSALHTTLFLTVILTTKFIFIKSSQSTHIQLLELSTTNKPPLHSTIEFTFYFLFTILKDSPQEA